MSATNDTQERTIPILPKCKGAALWGDHGACQCFSSALEASEARCVELARALEPFLRHPRFVSIGSPDNTAEVRVRREDFERAREALAAAPTREKGQTLANAYLELLTAVDALIAEVPDEWDGGSLGYLVGGLQDAADQAREALAAAKLGLR